MTAKTIRTGKLGKIELRLVDMSGVYHGIADESANRIVHIQGDGGEDEDRVWTRLHDEVAKKSASFFGYHGARTRFLKYFPGGFASDAYVGIGDKNGTGERAYKLAAKARLEATVTPEAAATGSGFAGAVIQAFADTNLLEPKFELPKVGQLMRGPNGDDFIRGAARFTLGDIKGGLAEMEKAARPHEAAKWTLVSYLPFLWRPEAHVFLKPQVTKDYAERVGHCFPEAYEPALRPEVYASLLDLYAKTGTAIADLAPRDNIDIQSFIWVVGKYTNEHPGA
jgi:hypothetical protein